MVRVFKVETPEQLRVLDGFRADEQASCGAYATVWSADRNGHGGVSKWWDDNFTVRFVAVRFGGREAYIDVKAHNKPEEKTALRKLKYNPALAWCRENLQLLSEE